jgi:hypothetical protein
MLLEIQGCGQSASKPPKQRCANTKGDRHIGRRRRRTVTTNYLQSTVVIGIPILDRVATSIF